MSESLQHEEWLKALRASERRLAASICSFRQEAGYQVFRSDEFPNFYAGNGILVEGQQPEIGLEDWIKTFRRNFPEDRYHHITLIFPGKTADQRLLDEAAARGFHVIAEVMMAASTAMIGQRAPASSPEPPTRPLNIVDREALYQLHLEEARTEDWFVDNKDFRELFQKTMTISDRVGIHWLGSFDPGSTELFSALGYFDQGRLCRLQEVMTAPQARGKGFASQLIRLVARMAQQRNVDSIGLFAEEDGEGHRLYLKLGFQELARDITVMHY